MILEGFTIGVEEEYHIVEPTTGKLKSRAHLVRSADLTGEVADEVQDTMLEMHTPVCRNAAEIAEKLRELRFQASAAAAAEEFEIMAAGIHPFSGWRGQDLTDGDRPRMLLGLFGQLIREQHICGMHIHVGVPEPIDRLPLMNIVRGFTPHLLALSCSSPFYRGEDSAFASFRMILWRGFPFAGVPPRFESSVEYQDFVDLLLRSGAIPDAKTVYWSVRPSSRYQTLELRMCDVCPRLSDAVAITALARALVVAASQKVLEPIGTSLSESLQDELLTENEWIAARDGLDANLIAPESSGGCLPIRRAISDLLRTVGPIADAFGDGEALGGVEKILDGGNAADRMRARLATGDIRAVVQYLVNETSAGTGIDRRTESR